MRILGLDTSGKTASAAILDTEKNILLGEHTVYTSRTHSQVIMPMCKNLLAECNMTVKDVDCFAVAVGPGSYTGLRIGIAAVQGMAMVNHTPCKGVSTLAAMAARVGSDEHILSVMHARENLFYYGIYQRHHIDSVRGGFHMQDMGTLAYTEEIAEKIKAYDKMMIVGDGAELFMEQYQKIRKYPLWIVYPPAVLQLQSAAGVCMAAAYDGNFGSASDLTASYLQAVQIQKKKSDK
ncbi:MAG: tRNA (adenosine(37)-N6)-threonylcarbamoyltransferase complex dimerization subunit type 1 TsaB [Oscillospiraceae bacterium]|nr:tRNA (adenosine(37)-N6)-threonylcarbamoyltransferase complex dimerization subunit type 1 TsaB [Oscillospiraceae bacterium]